MICPLISANNSKFKSLKNLYEYVSLPGNSLAMWHVIILIPRTCIGFTDHPTCSATYKLYPVPMV